MSKVELPEAQVLMDWHLSLTQEHLSVIPESMIVLLIGYHTQPFWQTYEE
jgi:hypothetical protein